MQPIKPIEIDEEFKERVRGETRIKDDESRWEACRRNAAIFMEEMLGIEPYWWQKHFLTEISKGVRGEKDTRTYVALTSRQIGKSTSLAVVGLWVCVFNHDSFGGHNTTKVGSFSMSDTQAKKLMYEIKNMIRAGDYHMREAVGVEDFFSDLIDEDEPNNKTTITFEAHDPAIHQNVLNGAKIGPSIRTYPPTNSVLGETFSTAFIDEAGKVSDEFYEDIFTPTMNAANGVRVITSTPWQSCYSDDTEVLTRDGWKLFKNIDIENDKFASRDENGKLVWEKALEYHEYDYSGEMYRFNTKSIDLLVTPNHKMVGKFQKADERSWVKAEELDNINTDFWIDTGLDANLPEKPPTITIPEYTFNRGNGTCTREEKTVDTHKFMRFLGMWAADGHAINNRVVITQNPGEILDYYKELCEDLFGEFTNVLVRDHGANSKRIKLHNQQLFEFIKGLKKEGIDPFKYDKESLKQFWKGFHDGDGDKNTTWSNNLKQLVITNDARYKDLSDSISLIQQILFGGSYIRQPGNRSDVHRVSARRAGRTKIKTYDDSQMWTEPYNGNVYCVTVPHGELFVRRNGKSGWCGNSGFFYELIKNRDNLDVEVFAFDVEALEAEEGNEQAERQLESVKDTIADLEARGKHDTIQRQYYCEFVQGTNQYFDPDVVDGMFTDSLKEDVPEDKAVDVGIDFGGSASSHTVITLSHWNDEKDRVERVWHKRYDINEDLNLLKDLKVINKTCNVNRWIPEKCPQSDYYIQKMETELGWNVTPFKPSRNKASAYSAFDNFLRSGQVYSYPDEDLKEEMKALVREETMRTTRIHAPRNYTDDMIDSFVISSYHFVQGNNEGRAKSYFDRL